MLLPPSRLFLGATALNLCLFAEAFNNMASPTFARYDKKAISIVDDFKKGRENCGMEGSIQVRRKRKRTCLYTAKSYSDSHNDWSQRKPWPHLDDKRDEFRCPSPFFDSDELWFRMARNKYLGPGLDPNASPPEEVHIILFSPDTDDESIHTIEFPLGSKHLTILAFECKLECHSFASNLKGHNLLEPSPYGIDFALLEAHCQTLKVPVQVVPKGTGLVPPSNAPFEGALLVEDDEMLLNGAVLPLDAEDSSWQ